MLLVSLSRLRERVLSGSEADEGCAARRLRVHHCHRRHPPDLPPLAAGRARRGAGVAVPDRPGRGLRNLGAGVVRRQLRRQRVQPALDRGVRGRTAAAGDRADIRHHLRRHRPVGRLHHGAGGDRAGAHGQSGDSGARHRRGSARRRRRCRAGLDDSRRRQRAADRAAARAAVHRHARHVWRGARRCVPAGRRHHGSGFQQRTELYRQRRYRRASPWSCC